MCGSVVGLVVRGWWLVGLVFLCGGFGGGVRYRRPTKRQAGAPHDTPHHMHAFNTIPHCPSGPSTPTKKERRTGVVDVHGGDPLAAG